MSENGRGREPSLADPRQGRIGYFDSMADQLSERGFLLEELTKVLRLKERLGDLQGMTILEPGCGCGRLTRFLVEWAGPQGRIIALDASSRMVDLARRAVGERGARTCEFHCADAASFPMPPRSVDLVLVFCVLPHLEDPAAAFAAFGKMLDPGGRLIVANLEGSEWLNRMHETAGEAVCSDRMPTHCDLLRMLDAADLRLVELVDREDDFYLEAVPRAH